MRAHLEFNIAVECEPSPEDRFARSIALLSKAAAWPALSCVISCQDCRIDFSPGKRRDIGWCLCSRSPDWLKELGLSEDVERFADNDIDTSVLGQLTNQDLRELGVSLGHRRKILAAIAGYRVAPASPSPDLKTPLSAAM